MSWQGPHRRPESLWRCDACEQAFQTHGIPPMHTRAPHQDQELVAERTFLTSGRREAHYCSDECLEDHDAREVREALTE